MSAIKFTRRQFGIFYGILLASIKPQSAQAASLDFATAIETGKNKGGRILVASGNYIIDRPVVIQGSNFQLVADGPVTLSCKHPNPVPIRIVDSKNVTLIGFTIIGNDKTSTAVSIEKSAGIVLEALKISTYMQSGVQILASTDCTIKGCRFKNALIEPRWDMAVATDVHVLGGDNKAIKIDSNTHRSGGGYGVAIRTNTAGERSTDHIISNNDIVGYNSYGIMLYRNGPSSQVSNQWVTGVSIVGNKISDISGARSASPIKTEIRDFGAGIYIQGAEETVIERNVIDNTNTATTSELLAPGCIGLASSGAATIKNNKMSQCKYGLYINDSLNFGNQDGAIVLDGNSFTKTSASSIKIVAKDNVIINNSTFDQTEQNFVRLSGGHGKKLMNRIVQSANLRR